jgi:hypothetical protein
LTLPQCSPSSSLYTISPATGAGALAESHCSDQLSVSTHEIVAGINVIAARNAHQLARSFQDAFDGGEGDNVQDDVGDADANAPDSEDYKESLVQASGEHSDLGTSAVLIV